MKIQLTSLKTRCLYAAAAALAVGAAHADAQSGKLTLSGYNDTSDTVTGALLAAHHYGAVIERLAPHASAFSADEVAASTDLCVAYAATHRLGEARESCNEAVKFAREEQPGITIADHKAHEQAVAIALANQSVVTQMGR